MPQGRATPLGPAEAAGGFSAEAGYGSRRCAAAHIFLSSLTVGHGRRR